MKFSSVSQSIFLRTFSALLNITIVWIVVMHFGKEQVGNLLAINSGLIIVTYILNFCWDQAIITKNERSFFLFNIVSTTILFVLVTNILSQYLSFPGLMENILRLSPLIVGAIFFIALSANAQNILRISKGSEKTYSIVLNSNMVGFLIATTFFKNIELIIFFQVFFSFLILLVSIYMVNREISFTYEYIKPNVSYKLFPLSLHGIINQNFLQFGLGYFGSSNTIPVALTSQRVMGLLTWPINYSIYFKGYLLKLDALFMQDKSEHLIIYILAVLVFIFLNLWLYYADSSLMLPAWILFIGYAIFSFKGDALFKNIYNHAYGFVYSLQIGTLISLFLFKHFTNSLYVVFILNSVYLSLISFHLKKT